MPAGTMLCVKNKIQWNAWIPPDLRDRAKETLQKLNLAADPKAGPSELTEIAMRRLLMLDYDEIRAIFVKWRVVRAQMGEVPTPAALGAAEASGRDTLRRVRKRGRKEKQPRTSEGA